MWWHKMRNEYIASHYRFKSCLVTLYLNFDGIETGKKRLGIWDCIPL